MDAKPSSAFGSWTKATRRRAWSEGSALMGHSATMAASSLADLTMTGTSSFRCAARAAAMLAACLEGVPLVARNTALPLLSNVATLV